MKKISKLLIFVLTVILIILLVNFYTSSKNDEKEKTEEKIFHSTTMNIIVVAKNKDKESFENFSVDVTNFDEPYQEFSIKIKDEKLWNLISVNGTYFVNVSWLSDLSVDDINGKTVTLQQIENIQLEPE